MKRASDITWETAVEQITLDSETYNIDYQHALNFQKTELLLRTKVFAINPFKSVLCGLPVFIVNSGPSLDDEACELLKKSKIPKIAVDNAVKKLAAHGIKPFLIVTTDLSEKCAEMIKGHITQETFVAVSPFVHPETLEEARKGRVMLYSITSGNSESFLYRFNQKYKVDQLSAMGTVGTVAASLAAFLDVERIIYAGLDLSYGKIEDVPEGKEPLQLDNGRYTIIDYWSSWLWYKNIIAASSNRPKIVQTTLYTHIEGAEHLSLAEAIAHYDIKKYPNYIWKMKKIWER